MCRQRSRDSRNRRLPAQAGKRRPRWPPWWAGLSQCPQPVTCTPAHETNAGKIILARRCGRCAGSSSSARSSCSSCSSLSCLQVWLEAPLLPRQWSACKLRACRAAARQGSSLASAAKDVAGLPPSPAHVSSLQGVVLPDAAHVLGVDQGEEGHVLRAGQGEGVGVERPPLARVRHQLRSKVG